MPTFAYTALKGNGKRVTGELDAGDRSAAMDLLDRGGLQPMKLDLKSESGKNDSKVIKSKVKNDEPLVTGPIKLKKSEIVLFTEELSELLGAGLQLEPALRVMENREELGKLKKPDNTYQSRGSRRNVFFRGIE